MDPLNIVLYLTIVIVIVIVVAFPISILITIFFKKQFWKTYIITSLVLFILGLLGLLFILQPMHWLTFFIVFYMVPLYIVLVLALSFPVSILITTSFKKQFWKTYKITSLVLFIPGLLGLLTVLIISFIDK